MVLRKGGCATQCGRVPFLILELGGIHSRAIWVVGTRASSARSRWHMPDAVRDKSGISVDKKEFIDITLANWFKAQILRAKSFLNQPAVAHDRRSENAC
jgi:hypothetical protein